MCTFFEGHKQLIEMKMAMSKMKNILMALMVDISDYLKKKSANFKK